MAFAVNLALKPIIYLSTIIIITIIIMTIIIIIIIIIIHDRNLFFGGVKSRKSESVQTIIYKQF